MNKYVRGAKLLLVSAMSLPLVACMGSGSTFEDTTAARVRSISDMGATIARDTTHRDPARVCPPGMTLVAASADYHNEAETRYRESYGSNRNGGRYRGGANGYTPRGRLKIHTQQEGEAEWHCEFPRPPRR